MKREVRYSVYNTRTGKWRGKANSRVYKLGRRLFQLNHLTTSLGYKNHWNDIKKCPASWFETPDPDDVLVEYEIVEVSRKPLTEHYEDRINESTK